jgi:hypothetical protein
MWLFAGAFGAIAIGMGLVVWINKTSPPPEPSVGPNVDHPQPPPTAVHDQSPAPTAATPDRHPPLAPAPVVRQAEPTPTPVVPVPVPVPQAPVYPAIVTLASAIDKPNIGNGIGDRMQVLGLRSTDLDRPAAITSLRMHFPVVVAEGKPAPAPEVIARLGNIFANETLGTLTGVPETRGGKPGLAVKWKAPGDAGAPEDAVFISFDKARPGLELGWRSAMLLKHPQLVGFAYWILQCSTLELEGGGIRDRNQQVAFKRFEPGTRSLDDDTEGAIKLDWPIETPAETVVTAPKASSLPSRWEATWYTDWAEKDAALRTPLNAMQVLKFRKPTTSGAIDAWFLITFQPGLGSATCNLSKRAAADAADLAQYQSDLRVVNQQIDEAKARLGGKLPDTEGARTLLRQQAENERLVEAYKAAVAAYHELNGFDIAFDLPDGLQLATLHLERGKAQER